MQLSSSLLGVAMAALRKEAGQASSRGRRGLADRASGSRGQIAKDDFLVGKGPVKAKIEQLVTPV